MEQTKYNGSSEKKLESVVSEPADVRKGGFFRKARNIFIADESQNIGTYLIYDVLLPNIKDTVIEMGHNAIDMLFYGKTKARSKSSYGSVSYTSYSSYSKKSDRSAPRRYDDFDDLVYNTRSDADRVLDELMDLIERYEFASIADLYELSGKTSHGYTDRGYGWRDLGSAYISRVMGGKYIINLPRPIQLPRD